MFDSEDNYLHRVKQGLEHKNPVSAIQRDREIAAKAESQGEWDGENIARLTTLGSGNSDHAARLHNRQPKYNALVDAVRLVANGVGWRGVAPVGFQALYEALAALDMEEKA